MIAFSVSKEKRNNALLEDSGKDDAREQLGDLYIEEKRSTNLSMRKMIKGLEKYSAVIESSGLTQDQKDQRVETLTQEPLRI